MSFPPVVRRRDRSGTNSRLEKGLSRIASGDLGEYHDVTAIGAKLRSAGESPMLLDEDDHRRICACLDRALLAVGVQRAADREDLVQEALLAYVKARDEVRNRDAWLITVVRRYASLRGRKEARRRELLQEHVEPFEQRHSSPSTQRLELLDLRKALSALSSAESRLLREVVLGSVPVTEIAERDGISVHAVRCRLSRTRSKLRVLIGRFPVSPPGGG